MRKSINARKIIIVYVVMCGVICRAGWLEDLHSGRTLSLGEGVKVRVEQDLPQGGAAPNHTHSYFGSHILKFFVGDAGFSVARAHASGGLKFGLFRMDDNGDVEARGSDANLFGTLLPLLIGFKIAGAILATLVAVLVVSVKAFLASTVALVLTVLLAGKKLLMGHAPAEVNYPVEFAPHGPYEGYDYPSAHGYSAGPSAHAGPLPSSFGTSGHEAVADSNISPQYTSATAAAASSGVTPTTAPQGGGKRRIFKRKNPIVPILTVHKITRQQVN